MIYIVLECDRYQEQPTKKLDTVYDNDGEYSLAKNKRRAMTHLLAQVLDIPEKDRKEFGETMDFKKNVKDNVYSFFGDEVDYIIIGVELE